MVTFISGPAHPLPPGWVWNRATRLQWLRLCEGYARFRFEVDDDDTPLRLLGERGDTVFVLADYRPPPVYRNLKE